MTDVDVTKEWDLAFRALVGLAASLSLLWLVWRILDDALA